MQAQEVESLPVFPQAPSGVSRKEHLPTVEASIRYWEAIRLMAVRENDPGLEQTATGMKLSYEEARLDLNGMKPDRPRAIRRRLSNRIG
jgi:hypothetical protein